ncbi:hypothetical protein HELRODRAFT_194058 [Helobdella robusta]|uniref:Ubiquitin carboxyl-terminal hydrolase n=1 Tax=Helobdella robusta TaxID=6412 RepID=T1FVM6_HELRO|nr:hypothetical protein HELRODRAFT_194058 [Helobdella robusta]ESN93535.1 hypothetical protein HELRODRAFT_194058 [Helobdella robusta]
MGRKRKLNVRDLIGTKSQISENDVKLQQNGGSNNNCLQKSLTDSAIDNLFTCKTAAKNKNAIINDYNFDNDENKVDGSLIISSSYSSSAIFSNSKNITAIPDGSATSHSALTTITTASITDPITTTLTTSISTPDLNLTTTENANNDSLVNLGCDSSMSTQELPKQEKKRKGCLSLKKKFKNGVPASLATIDNMFSTPPNKNASINKVKEVVKPEEYLIPGLVNLGNSCYLNSVIQALYYIPSFKTNVDNLHSEIERISSDVDVIANVFGINRLFERLEQAQILSHPSVCPSELHGALESINPLFKSNIQQDCHEFLQFTLAQISSAIQQLNTIKNNYSKIMKNYIMAKLCRENIRKNIITGSGGNHIEMECNRCVKLICGINFSDTKNFVNEMFQGDLLRITRCMECEEDKTTNEKYMDVPVTINNRRNNTRRCGDNCGGNYDEEDNEDEDVHDDMYRSIMNSSEKLTGENKFYCRTCAQFTEVERKVAYYKCPNVLLIHMHRFTNSFFNMSGYYCKVMSNMKIPVSMPCLEINCTNPNHQYRLHAIVSHSGFSLSSGHYITYMKMRKDAKKEESNHNSNNNNSNNNNNKNVNNNNTANNNDADDKASLEVPHDKIPTPLSSLPSSSSSTTAVTSSSSLTSSPLASSDWLELNDHQVRRISKDEVDKLLGAQSNSSNNPYLLFFVSGDI